MLFIYKIFNRIKSLFGDFISLKVVSLKRTLFLISISIFVTIFDALSVISIMPLIQFIESGQNVELFISNEKYAEILVKIFNFLSIPFELVFLAIMVCLLIFTRQLFNLKEVVEREKTRLKINRDLTMKCFSEIMISNASYIITIKSGEFLAVCET